MKAIFFVLYFSLNIIYWATSLNNNTSEVYYPMSCKDLSQDQLIRNIIQIQVDPIKDPFYVKCNHEVEGGGWTIILNRYDGNKDFNCKWDDCKRGFGNINREFFIGLEKLHDITSSSLHELLVIMKDSESQNSTARYDAFAIDNESNSYMLSVLGNYTGDAGDTFENNSGHKFVTYDRDSAEKCGDSRKGPGWFDSCPLYYSHLFGRHNSDDLTHSMCWNLFRCPLTKLSMLIRPLNK